MNKISRFTGTLLPHQEEARRKLRESGALLLYHGLGSGKTITAIAGAEDDPDGAVVEPLHQSRSKLMSRAGYYE